MDFLLDPYVIAVPRTITSTEQLSKYVSSLLAWINLHNSSGHDFWFTSHLAIALTQDDSYPYPSVIKRSCKGIKIDDENALNLETVIRIIQRDFMEPPYLDDKIGNVQVDFELIESVVLPEEIQARLPPTVAFALKKSLVEMAIAYIKNGSELAQNVFVATNPLPANSSEVEVDITHLVDEDTKEQLYASWRLITHPSQLDEIEGLSVFWSDTHRALNWAFDQLQACGAIDNTQNLPKPAAGLKFNESIRGFHPDNNPALLDAIFRNTILALLCSCGFERYKFARNNDGKLNKHHALQDKPKHQMERADGATAWRVHLSGSYRLHYWLLKDGQAELAKVVIHEDYSMD